MYGQRPLQRKQSLAAAVTAAAKNHPHRKTKHLSLHPRQSLRSANSFVEIVLLSDTNLFYHLQKKAVVTPSKPSPAKVAAKKADSSSEDSDSSEEEKPKAAQVKVAVPNGKTAAKSSSSDESSSDEEEEKASPAKPAAAAKAAKKDESGSDSDSDSSSEEEDKDGDVVMKEAAPSKGVLYSFERAFNHHT